MARTALVVILLFAASLFGGCGTIVHGSSQCVNFNTNPQGATLRFDDGMMYTTPSQVKLERKKDYVVTISKEGYQTQTVPLNSVLSGWLAGNLLFGGIIGGGVDLISGAAWTLTPEQVVMTLAPLAPGQVADAAPAGPMSIEDKLRAIDRLHQQGVLKDNEYEASKKKLVEELTKASSHKPNVGTEPQ
jgi:hypothetical protein